MAWYSRARSSFKAAMSSFRVMVFAVEDCGASFISLSFYGKCHASKSSMIRLVCTEYSTGPVLGRQIFARWKTAHRQASPQRGRIVLYLFSLSPGVRTDLRGRAFRCVAVGFLASVGCVFHVASYFVHVLLCAVGPLLARAYGFAQCVLSRSDEIITSIFARLWREQNPDCCSHADANNKRRNSFRPSHSLHKASMFVFKVCCECSLQNSNARPTGSAGLIMSRYTVASASNRSHT